MTESPEAGSPISRQGSRRRLLVVFRWTVVALTIAGLCWATRSSWLRLGESAVDWQAVRWAELLLAVPWTCAALLLAGSFWWLVLRELGADLAAGPALRAFLASQLGKYVPGKAMVIAIRAALVVPRGVRLPLAVGSVFIETLMWVAVAAVLGLVALAVSGISLREASWWAGLAAAGCGITTAPPVVGLMVSRLGKRWPQASGKLPAFGWRIWALGWCFSAAGWCCSAAAMRQILEGIGPERCGWELFPVCLAATSLAMVIGFVPMVPGGLGVRELVTLPLLATAFPPAQALAATVFFRLVSLGSEVLMTIAAGGLGRKRPG